MGLRKRLSLAVAVLHDPQILILDEPTSGVDPVARDSFWELLIDLSRTQGVTIFVTTHFMNEGMRCDRISLMHAGRVLASDTQQRLMEQRGLPTLEAVFIAYLQEAAGLAPVEQDSPSAVPAHVAPPATATSIDQARFSPRRLLSYARREAMELSRDPIRLAMALVGTVLLMFVLGRLFALSWIDVLGGRNVYALVFFTLIATLLFYLPATNRMLQDGEGVVAFYCWLGVWLVGRARVPVGVAQPA